MKHINLKSIRAVEVYLGTAEDWAMASVEPAFRDFWEELFRLRLDQGATDVMVCTKDAQVIALRERSLPCSTPS
jgi:hypothetical protein